MVYPTAETIALRQSAGFGRTTTIELPSSSLALVASRSIPYPDSSSLSGLKITPWPTFFCRGRT